MNVDAHFLGGPRDGWRRLMPKAPHEIKIAIGPIRVGCVSDAPAPASNSFREGVYELAWMSRRSRRAVYEYRGDEPAARCAAEFHRPLETGHSMLEGRVLCSRALIEDGMLHDESLANIIGADLVAAMRRTLKAEGQ